MTVAVEIDDRIGKCRKILEMDPNSQIFAALAEAYRKKGGLEKAFKICQNGLRIHPSYGSAHVVMAKINLDRGLYDWAEVEARKAAELGGNTRAVELLLAEIHLYKGEHQVAAKLLKKLHQVDPENAQIKKLLEIALKIPGEQAAEKSRQTRESVSTAVVEKKSEEKPDREPSTLSSAEILREAAAIPHLSGALFINSEGLVVESEWAADIDVATCGAALSEVSKSLNQELVRVSFGQVNTVQIETGQHIFYLLQASDGVFLFVGDAQTNLGTLRMKTAALLGRYEVK